METSLVLAEMLVKDSFDLIHTVMQMVECGVD
jgi:hypothetical protein